LQELLHFSVLHEQMRLYQLCHEENNVTLMTHKVLSEGQKKIAAASSKKKSRKKMKKGVEVSMTVNQGPPVGNVFYFEVVVPMQSRITVKRYLEKQSQKCADYRKARSLLKTRGEALAFQNEIDFGGQNVVKIDDIVLMDHELLVYMANRKKNAQQHARRQGLNIDVEAIEQKDAINAMNDDEVYFWFTMLNNEYRDRSGEYLVPSATVEKWKVQPKASGSMKQLLLLKWNSTQLIASHTVGEAVESSKSDGKINTSKDKNTCTQQVWEHLRVKSASTSWFSSGSEIQGRDPPMFLDVHQQAGHGQLKPYDKDAYTTVADQDTFPQGHPDATVDDGYGVDSVWKAHPWVYANTYEDYATAEYTNVDYVNPPNNLIQAGRDSAVKKRIVEREIRFLEDDESSDESDFEREEWGGIDSELVAVQKNCLMIAKSSNDLLQQTSSTVDSQIKQTRVDNMNIGMINQGVNEAKLHLDSLCAQFFTAMLAKGWRKLLGSELTTTSFNLQSELYLVPTEIGPSVCFTTEILRKTRFGSEKVRDSFMLRACQTCLYIIDISDTKATYPKMHTVLAYKDIGKVVVRNEPGYVELHLSPLCIQQHRDDIHIGWKDTKLLLFAPIDVHKRCCESPNCGGKELPISHKDPSVDCRWDGCVQLVRNIGAASARSGPNACSMVEIQFQETALHFNVTPPPKTNRYIRKLKELTIDKKGGTFAEMEKVVDQIGSLSITLSTKLDQHGELLDAQNKALVNVDASLKATLDLENEQVDD